MDAWHLVDLGVFCIFCNSLFLGFFFFFFGLYIREKKFARWVWTCFLFTFGGFIIFCGGFVSPPPLGKTPLLVQYK